NANVLIWKALGPHPEGAMIPGKFFQLMGVEAPPEKGKNFIDQGEYLKNHLKIDPMSKEADEFYRQVAQCAGKPWSSMQYPKVASWLKANEESLAMVFEATKRSHYFSPNVPPRSEKGPGGLIAVLLPGVQKCRGLANLLVAQGMLCISQGKDDEAWQYLLACHRFGRLVGRGATLIEVLVGFAIEGLAIRAELGFLGGGDLETKAIKSCLKDLEKLPPVPQLTDQVDLGQRFIHLDLINMADRYGVKYFNSLGGGDGKEPGLLEELGAEFALNGIDWDPAFRSTNRMYDRLAVLTRTKERASRQKQWGQIKADLEALKESIDSGESAKKIASNIAGGKSSAKERGHAVGDILVFLITPAVQKVQDSVDRTKQFNDNLRLAFALEWYRREHKSYPKKLDALTPEYLKETPIDLFTGKPLIYRSFPSGYTLYSVGVNGEDDGGRGYDDDPRGDDIVIRMPLP
ncbi:MAG TPA: hypothetical protein VN966_03910, partial [Candidatus Bathyarchaeia archaeon]|nr:hypothetical protein [Candidatus Bathyarchaeia archaeon]